MTTKVDITGTYGTTEGSIHILDEHGEVVMWDSAEWVEDPSLVYVIAEAVREALVDGTAEIRMRINRPYDALDEDGHAYPGDLTDHRDPDHAENGECVDCADLPPADRITYRQHMENHHGWGFDPTITEDEIAGKHSDDHAHGDAVRESFTIGDHVAEHAEMGEADLPTGYRWLNERESERYGAHPGDMPDVIVVPRTFDSTGVRFTQGEADLARPIS